MDTSPSEKPRRPRGRPKKADAPIVPWDEVARLLVFGEVAKNPDTGIEAVKFPSLAELGARYGVSRNRVWQYASKARCYQRREEARLKTQERYEQKVVEKVAEAAAAVANTSAATLNPDLPPPLMDLSFCCSNLIENRRPFIGRSPSSRSRPREAHAGCRPASSSPGRRSPPRASARRESPREARRRPLPRSRGSATRNLRT
jgi:hypothetical protein